MTPVSGIYRITAPDGRFYIGSTLNLRRRWQQHRQFLASGKHPNRRLQGLHDCGEALVFAIVEACSREQLIEREQWHMDTHRPALNVSRLARCPVVSGRPRDAATRAKIAATLRGRKRPGHPGAAALTAWNKALRGKPRRPEHSAAIAAAVQRRKAQAID